MRKNIFFKSGFNNFIVVYRRIKKIIYPEKKIYVFGDSHTHVFNFINENRLSNRNYIVSKVDGATAMGMVNPNSKTNALEKFMDEIKKISKKSKLIFLLGEVDCGFLIWYRHLTFGLPIEEQIKKSVENYINFLKDILVLGYKNISVISSPLPCIKDENAPLQEIELRRSIKVSLKDRTSLSLEYNKKLKRKCEKLKIKFVDTDVDLLNAHSEIIKEKFINKNVLNHHLSNEEFSKLIISKIE